MVQVRYFIMAMIFATTYICYCTRSNMSISLPAMVKHKGKKKFVAECNKDKEVSNDTSKVEKDTGEKFEWDETAQGQILAAYFDGYLFGSLPAGAIADLIGPCWTIWLSTFIAAVLNSVCVWASPLHWGALFAVRFIMGITGGLVYPALQTLIGRWAPPQEKTKFVACLMGNTLGTCLTWIIGGWVTQNYKWPMGFHVMTLQCVVYLGLFALFTADRPEEHRWIKEEELKYIKESQEGKVTKTKGVAPIKDILLSFPFWTLCVLHFGNLYGLTVQLTAVPKFIKEFIGFDIKNSGALSSLPHISRLILGTGYGFLGDYLKKKKYKRVLILKAFIFFSHILPGLCMSLIILSGCNSAAAVALLTLSMSINGAAVVTNLANPTDLSPNFAGTIFGFMTFVGGISGIIVSPITGAYIDGLKDKPKLAWGLVFATGGAVYAFCGIFFIIFGTADVQPWNDKAP